ncbi:MAG TPA: hypothetical protein VN700_14720 [Vicinamibacterales bacterium]|nr:hypothetical protein [Vicinamibacterales bacterium]
MTRRTRWQRVRLILLATILVALVGYVGCDVWSGRRIAIELANLESRYGSLSSQSASPEVPAAENRARLVKAAAALVNTVNQKDQTELSRFMRDPAARTVPPALTAYIDTNAQAIALARQFVARPRSSFAVDYRGSNNRPDLLEIRMLANVLFLATVQAIENGKLDEAAALVVANESLSSAGRNEPDLITQLIRIAVADITANGLQRLLESGTPSKASLTQLAQALAENREPAPITIGLMGEVKTAHWAFSQLEAGRKHNLAETGLSSAVSVPWPRLVRPYFRTAHARYLAEAGRLLDIQTGPRPRPAGEERRYPPAWALIDRLALMFTNGLMRSIETGDDFARTQAAAEIAVALRRHKIDWGTYPDDLPVLVPTYLSQLPIDPSTGKPPIYKPDAEGFTLTTSPSINYAATKRPTAVWKITR